MVRALTAEPQADADLLRDFRDLFRLPLDEVAGTGISRRTWARIEAGEGRDYAPTVQAKVRQIRTFMQLLGEMPYGPVRRWVTRPLRGVGKSPRTLVRTSTLALNTLIRPLVAQQGVGRLARCLNGLAGAWPGMARRSSSWSSPGWSWSRPAYGTWTRSYRTRPHPPPASGRFWIPRPRSSNPPPRLVHPLRDIAVTTRVPSQMPLF